MATFKRGRHISYASQEESYFNYLEKFIRFLKPVCFHPSLLFLLPSAYSPIMISQKLLKWKGSVCIFWVATKRTAVRWLFLPSGWGSQKWTVGCSILQAVSRESVKRGGKNYGVAEWTWGWGAYREWIQDREITLRPYLARDPGTGFLNVARLKLILLTAKTFFECFLI